MSREEKQLCALALRLERWADCWPKNLRVKTDPQPWVEMRETAAQIRKQFGGDQPGGKWREFVMEGFC